MQRENKGKLERERENVMVCCGSAAVADTKDFSTRVSLPRTKALPGTVSHIQYTAMLYSPWSRVNQIYRLHICA